MTDTGRGAGAGAETTVASAGEGPTVLVLGGGGMKGIAHIGAMRALEAAAIRPDAIVGTSIGALIGALLAGGLGWRELVEVTRRMKKDDIVSINRRAFWLGGVRAASVFDPDPFKEWMERVLPVWEFGAMMVPFRFNATSLITGREVWFGSGRKEDVSLVDAVYASCALPVYFPPMHIGEDVLVDGGVINPLPLSEAATFEPARVIAIDVGADLSPPAEGFFDQGLIAIHDRVLSLNLQHRRTEALEKFSHLPLLYVRPRIGHLHTFDFERTQFFMEEGYRATSEALEAAAI